jgi:ubiquitin carboxyl-terminal hydrolase 4/11/15
MERTIFTFNGYYAKDNNCRIWKFQSKENPLGTLYKEIYKSTKDLTIGDDMTFEFSGDLLERASDKPFGELQIDENTVIIIEVLSFNCNF